MSVNLKPDLHVDAKGWANLPPESRDALYPLLQKKRLTGRDIGRISMFNAIAAFNGERVLDEEALRSMAATMTDAGWKIYNKYMAAFFVLSRSTELVSQLADSISMTCDILHLHIENALLENIDCNVCNIRRYDIGEIANFKQGGEITKSISIHNEWHDIWVRGNELIKKCAIERLMFKTAGMTLNVPGLEAMLNSVIKGLIEVINVHTEFTESARNSLLNLELPENNTWVILDWTQPLRNIYTINVPDTIMRKARRALSLDNFAYDYSMLDDVFRKCLS